MGLALCSGAIDVALASRLRGPGVGERRPLGLQSALERVRRATGSARIRVEWVRRRPRNNLGTLRACSESAGGSTPAP